MTKFSIILPIYNVEKYLSKCLDSIINQTHRNIEIICINDGSTDNSLQILEEYTQKDGRIKIINQKNQGVSIARNVGIENATGDYILFIDADDWIELDACEVLLNTINNKKFDLIYFNYYAINSNIKRKINIVNKKITKNYFLTNGGLWNCCYNADFIKKNKISFPKDIKISEDLVFKTIIILNNPKIEVISEPLYNYFYTRENSATKNYTQGIIENIKGFEYLKSTEIYQKTSEEIKLLIVDNWSKLIFSAWSAIPLKLLKNDFNGQINFFLKNYKQFNYKDYKNLIGYKRLKNKWLIRFLKNIRDLFFNIICKVNKNAK